MPVAENARPRASPAFRARLLAAVLFAACQPQPAPSLPAPGLPAPSPSAVAPAPSTSAVGPSATTSAATPPPSLSAAPSAPTARRGPLARRSHRRRDDGDCPDHDKGMAAGRKRTLNGDYQGALEAFTEALRAEPLDARAWAELGYAAFLAGYDARGELHIARSLTRDKALLAQIWFNERLAEERAGDAEAARRGFVLAEAAGSKAAEKKLGDASRCAATWTTDPKERDDLAIVGSWKAAYAAASLLCGEETPPRTDAEAKRALCMGCQYPGTPDTTDACVGPAPWTISRGCHQAHCFYALVQPLPGGRMFVEPFSDGDGGERLAQSGEVLMRETPARGEWPSTGMSLSEPEGPYVTNRDYWFDDAPEEDADGGTFCPPLLKGEVDFPRAICMQCFQPLLPLGRPRQLHYYAPSTGRELLRLSVWNGDVKATLRGSTATISGGECQATVTLPAR